MDPLKVYRTTARPSHVPAAVSPEVQRPLAADNVMIFEVGVFGIPPHCFVGVTEHSGNEAGNVRSLKLAETEVEDRVSDMKVLKQGVAPPNRAGLLRLTPSSRNSPVANELLPLVSKKLQPPVATRAGTSACFP